MSEPIEISATQDQSGRVRLAQAYKQSPTPELLRLLEDIERDSQSVLLVLANRCRPQGYPERLMQIHKEVIEAEIEWRATSPTLPPGGES